ncbi:MAG: PhoU domain-containing protein, partial [Candidatus Ornithomonoglobus sp.]
TYSKDALKNLQSGLSLIGEMYSGALGVMKDGSGVSVKDILKKKEKVLDLDIDMRKDHMKRVAKGKCKASLTASFNNVLHTIDRMGNNCVNIAEAVSGSVDFGYFTGVDEV